MPCPGGRLKLWRLMVAVAAAAVFCVAVSGIADPNLGIALIASSVFLLACARCSAIMGLSRLMAAVAVAAVVCAAVRGDGSPDLGIALIATSVILLACAYYSATMTLRRSQGFTTSRLRKVALLPVSLVTATALVGLSDLAFLIGYEFNRSFLTPKASDGRWDLEPDVTIKGAILGAILAVGVASVLRIAIWPCEPIPTGLSSWRLRSKARAVAGLLASAILLLAAYGAIHWRNCCMWEARKYARYEAEASYPDRAAAYGRSKRWYEQAAFRPWMLMNAAD